MGAATTYLTEPVTGLHPFPQFFAVFAIGLIPFLESHVGAFVGTVTGVPVVLASLAAIAGNLLALLVAIRAGGAVAHRVAQRRTTAPARRTQKGASSAGAVATCAAGAAHAPTRRDVCQGVRPLPRATNHP